MTENLYFTFAPLYVALTCERDGNGAQEKGMKAERYERDKGKKDHNDKDIK
jgi:hypothetical protein